MTHTATARPRPPSTLLAGGAVLGAAGVVTVAVTVPVYAAVAAVPLAGAGVLAWIDQRTTRIATVHAGVLAAVTLAACAIGIAVDRGTWGAVAAGAALWTIPLFGLAVFARFGGGDFKYGFSLGALTGWISLSCSLTGLLLGVLAASLAALAAALRQHSMHAQIPLAVPLFTGTVLAVALQAVMS